ncbi:MAG TPA: TlpA disulfide reductase family protein [Pyrinomonadaceae bacterium]
MRTALAITLAALALAAAACTRPDYTKQSISYTPDNANTPRGSSMPQTSVPMPPVNAARVPRGGGAKADEASLGASVWTTLDGRSARPSDYHGKVLVLDFWATYCPPCRDETPHLVELQRRYGARGLQIVGLNVGGEDDRAKVPAFVREFGIQYPLGYPADAMNELYFADNDVIPQTYVFDRRGRLLKHFVGFDSTAVAELENVIKSALDD